LFALSLKVRKTLEKIFFLILDTLGLNNGDQKTDDRQTSHLLNVGEKKTKIGYF
jgi:hypothetical protein